MTECLVNRVDVQQQSTPGGLTDFPVFYFDCFVDRIHRSICVVVGEGFFEGLEDEAERVGCLVALFEFVELVDADH